MIRTIWFAGFLLLILGGLLAMKMVSAAAPTSDDASEATAALTQIVPGENTLTEADRGVVAPDADEAPLMMIESSTVRLAHAEYVPPKRTRAVAKPRPAAGKPTKTAEMKSCRQLDPIARFLVAANLAPPCAG